MSFSISFALRRLAVAVLAATGAAGVFAAQFEPEPLGQIAELPSPNPDHWLVVHDIAFNHMREGRFYLVDPAAESIGGQMRGIVSGDFIASFAVSAKRNEYYVIETFHARGGRGGERTDVVTIYDPGTLQVRDEIVIPPKRLSGMPHRYQVTLLDDDRYLLVYNFTPSQSVTVIDLEERKVLGEVPIAGCSFVFPTGKRGFSSLCSDGGLLTTRLQEDGGVADTNRLRPFNDVINDAMFGRPAEIGGVFYFPTFTGNVVPIDMSGAEAAVGTKWSLTTAAERAAGWRPGGPWPATGHPDGRLYVLMHADGGEGTHKNGGSEVWIFDAAKGERLARVELARWGVALGMSSAADPMLLVTGAEPVVDVYQADGAHIKTLAIQADTPLLVYGVR
jgi:methylamine dehydrogenase heavy chain